MVITGFCLATAASAYADVRVSLRLGVGHPIRRPVKTVVVRPARPNIVVRPQVSYIAPVLFTRTVVALPDRDRIIREDSERIHRREDWVDLTLGVNNRGERLLLKVEGRAQVDFAEVHFDNGQVQVVDFNEQMLNRGVYNLLNFSDGRKVEHVRLVARARSEDARLSVLMVR